MKAPGGRFTFSTVRFRAHKSQLLSTENIVLYSGSTFVLGGPEGVRAMNSQVHVCAWMQFEVGGNNAKLHQGDLFIVGNHQIMLAGFQRSIHSDTYVFCVAHPDEVFQL